MYRTVSRFFDIIRIFLTEDNQIRVAVKVSNT